ncbi:hypothetical protein H0H92_007034 [Tricholoma furcatifolium]|nr:hypothetical protein H0H92_007034 [Tricholoma furcatifolium]
MLSGPAASSFMFPPIYPDDPPQQLIPGEPSDFSTRYRMRADLLRRRGEEVALTGSLSLPPPPRSAGAFSDLDLRMRPQTSSSSGSWTWESSGVRSGYAAPWAGQTLARTPRPIIPLSTDFRPSMPISRSHHQHQQHTRSTRAVIPTEYDLETLDFSDASTTSSRSSTSVSVAGRIAGRIGRGFDASLGDYSPPPLDTHTVSQPHSQLSSYQPSPTVPGFVPASVAPQDFDESAFGALSLEDPALLAPDAPPFFSEELVAADAAGSGSVSVAGGAGVPNIDPNATPTGVPVGTSAMEMGMGLASVGMGGGAGARLARAPSMGPGVTAAASGVSEGDGELWRAFMRNTPLAEGGPGQHPLYGQRPHSASSTTTSSSTSTSYPSYSHAQQYQQHHQYDRRMSLGHIHRQPQHQQPPDDLAAYQAAVLLHARETESEIVLRQPPSASTLKQRRSTDSGLYSGPGLALPVGSRPGALPSLQLPSLLPPLLPPPPPQSAPALSGDSSSSALLRPIVDVPGGASTAVPRPESAGSLSNASASPSSLVSSSLVGAVGGMGTLNEAPLLSASESWADAYASTPPGVDSRPGMKRPLSSVATISEEPEMKRRGVVGEGGVAEGVALEVTEGDA